MIYLFTLFILPKFPFAIALFSLQFRPLRARHRLVLPVAGAGTPAHFEDPRHRHQAAEGGIFIIAKPGLQLFPPDGIDAGRAENGRLPFPLLPPGSGQDGAGGALLRADGEHGVRRQPIQGELG